MVELEADLAADLLPALRVDLVHHVHQNRVEDRQAQRLRSTQRNTRDHVYVCILERLCMYVCMYVCMYAIYVRNTYTYTHTHTFMDLSKDLINILCTVCMYVCMYVCMSEVSGRQCES